MAKVDFSVWNVFVIAIVALLAVEVGPQLPVVGNLISSLKGAV